MDDERRRAWDGAAFPERRTGDGRRAHPRVQVSLPVSGTGRYADHIVEATDLSVGGLAMLLPEPLPAGAQANVLLDVPGSDIAVRALVEVTERAVPRDGGYEVGVRFLGLDPSDARVIEAHLDRLRRSGAAASKPR